MSAVRHFSWGWYLEFLIYSRALLQSFDIFSVWPSSGGGQQQSAGEWPNKLDRKKMSGGWPRQSGRNLVRLAEGRGRA